MFISFRFLIKSEISEAKCIFFFFFLLSGKWAEYALIVLNCKSNQRVVENGTREHPGKMHSPGTTPTKLKAQRLSDWPYKHSNYTSNDVER